MRAWLLCGLAVVAVDVGCLGGDDGGPASQAAPDAGPGGDGGDGDEGACEIGGCSSHLCVDPTLGPIATTCEFREEYVCFRTATCERQENGLCGWTATEALDTCLTNATGGGGEHSAEPR